MDAEKKELVDALQALLDVSALRHRAVTENDYVDVVIAAEKAEENARAVLAKL